VVYGITTTRAIGESIYSADDVMATGFNWVTPLAVIDAFGGAEKFKELAYMHLDSKILSKLDLTKTFKDIPRSKYDYRPFFKAR
jgi:3-hydroxyacyl-CoA dehydrogenase